MLVRFASDPVLLHMRMILADVCHTTDEVAERHVLWVAPNRGQIVVNLSDGARFTEVHAYTRGGPLSVGIVRRQVHLDADDPAGPFKDGEVTTMLHNVFCGGRV